MAYYTSDAGGIFVYFLYQILSLGPRGIWIEASKLNGCAYLCSSGNTGRL